MTAEALVAPPCGERGLKSFRSRSAPRCQGRSPLRGAWIEIAATEKGYEKDTVAPPCGERGLK